MKKTIAGHIAEAVAELVHRLRDAEVDGIVLEVGHTTAGAKVIALSDRGYTVLLTVTEAESVLRAMKRMVIADPTRNTPQICMVAEALLIALADKPPPFVTVH